MKRLFCILILLSSTLLYGMEGNDSGQSANSKSTNMPAEDLQLPHEVIMQLVRLADESNDPSETLQKVMTIVLGKNKEMATFNLPAEVIIYLVNVVEFSTPLELMGFLFKLSSINRHWRHALKREIVKIACKKFGLDEELTGGFLELINNKSGIPIEYLHNLLINKERQVTIKNLREIANADLKQVIKNLESAVRSNKRNETMDIIMSLPRENISNINCGSLLKTLIDNNETVVIKMLIGAGININAPMILVVSIYIEDPLTALSYSVYIGYYEIVKLLLDEGANINAIDCNGRRALDFTTRGGSSKNPKIIELLQDHRAMEGPQIEGPWRFQPFSPEWEELEKFKEGKQKKIIACAIWRNYNNKVKF